MRLEPAAQGGKVVLVGRDGVQEVVLRRPLPVVGPHRVGRGGPGTAVRTWVRFRQRAASVGPNNSGNTMQWIIRCQLRRIFRAAIFFTAHGGNLSSSLDRGRRWRSADRKERGTRAQAAASGAMPSSRSISM